MRKKHRKILIRQILPLFLIFILAWLLSGLVPALIGSVIRAILLIAMAVFSGTVIVFVSLQIIQNFRFERSFLPIKMDFKPLPVLNKYRILNPLDVPGTFKKAQLHTHSNLSYDSDTPPEKVIESYQKDDYHFLAITDHDRFSDFAHLSTENFLVLSGVEETVPILFWPIPLGKHLIIINPPDKRPHSATVQERINQAEATEGIVIPAHLGWRGGAGTGRWFPEELYKLKNLQFIEIYSYHSMEPADFTIWHQLVIKGGPYSPVWGIAVDDSHTGSTKKGWIEVKTERIDLVSFVAALRKGAFYATNGPSLEIKVIGHEIRVSAPGAVWIRVYNAQNQVVLASRKEEAAYQSFGDEGFLRVEATDLEDRTAWSQPLWLVKEE
jgi:hypothetical protein